MVRAVQDAVAGRLQPVRQWTKGRLYFRRDRKPRHYRELMRALDAGLLRDYPAGQTRRDSRVRLIGDPALLAEAVKRAAAQGHIWKAD